MSYPLVGEAFYEKYKAVIDPTAFIATSVIGFEKLRSLEWINGPITQQGMAFLGVVNGLAIYLSYRIGNGDKQESLYIKSVLTLLGFVAGAIAAPYVASKILKNQAVLITPQMAFRITGLNLVTKVFVYVAFTLAERQYNSWNFPSFQNLQEMSEQTVGLYYEHFKKNPDEWKKQTFNRQLAFNACLLAFKQDPLDITFVDLGASLTKTELATFLTLLADGDPTPEQATILYKFHVPPQDRRYPVESLPFINPREVNIGELSDEQIRWHHETILAKRIGDLPESQIVAFVPHFYRLDLIPPSEKFVAELPLPKKTEELTIHKVSYLAHFYGKEPKRNDLSLKDQLLLNNLFDKFDLNTLPLHIPSQGEIAFLEKDHLAEIREHFKKNGELWNEKTPDYQKAFNKALTAHDLKPLPETHMGWSTGAKIALVAVVVVAIATGIVIADTRIGTRLREKKDGPPKPPLPQTDPKEPRKYEPEVDSTGFSHRFCVPEIFCNPGFIDTGVACVNFMHFENRIIQLNVEEGKSVHVEQLDGPTVDPHDPQMEENFQTVPSNDRKTQVGADGQELDETRNGKSLNTGENTPRNEQDRFPERKDSVTADLRTDEQEVQQSASASSVGWFWLPVLGVLGTICAKAKEFVRCPPKKNVFTGVDSKREDRPIISFLDQASVVQGITSENKYKIPAHLSMTRTQRDGLDLNSYIDLLRSLTTSKHATAYLEIDVTLKLSGRNPERIDYKAFVDKLNDFPRNDKVQALSLRGFKSISKEQLTQIKKKFPKAYYFDLKGETIVEHASEELQQKGSFEEVFCENPKQNPLGR